MTFSGVLAIIENKDRYLVILNKKTGNITFPAGAIEENESDKDALIREVKEETGLDKDDYSFKDTGLIYEFYYNSKKSGRYKRKASQKVFLLKTKKEDLTPIDKDVEIMGWFKKEEASQKINIQELKDLFLKIINN